MAAPVDFFTPEQFSPETSVMYLLRLALVGMGRTVNRELAMEESTLPQWLPLFKAHKGGANTVAELARQCTIDVSTMTRLLDRLEKKGLCRRERSTTDRRVVHIVLTAQGRAVAERVPEVLCRVYNQALAGFSAAEWQQLQAMLTRLGHNACALAEDGLHGPAAPVQSATTRKNT
ncbi:MarR family winged helix-turn-helix transcriptional regulator [Ottowia sp.]|uniref:MarR family winged helix-turn-helix transcriptional regulator n=1 Tax=Ottowia sp. TaxID=1898956 RepID=UPI003A8838D6